MLPDPSVDWATLATGVPNAEAFGATAVKLDEKAVVPGVPDAEAPRAAVWKPPDARGDDEGVANRDCAGVPDVTNRDPEAGSGAGVDAFPNGEGPGAAPDCTAPNNEEDVGAESPNRDDDGAATVRLFAVDEPNGGNAEEAGIGIDDEVPGVAVGAAPNVGADAEEANNEVLAGVPKVGAGVDPDPNKDEEDDGVAPKSPPDDALVVDPNSMGCDEEPNKDDELPPKENPLLLPDWNAILWREAVTDGETQIDPHLGRLRLVHLQLLVRS